MLIPEVVAASTPSPLSLQGNSKRLLAGIVLYYESASVLMNQVLELLQEDRPYICDITCVLTVVRVLCFFMLCLFTA